MTILDTASALPDAFAAATSTTLALPDWLGFLNAETLISWFSSWAVLGICVVLFIETGLFFPFLPGDSLLFIAGMLIASGDIKEPEIVVALTFFVAAFAGDQFSYMIGRRFGTRLFKPGSRVFKPEYLVKTSAYFDKYGGKTVVLARFVPIVRTFAPAVAGAGTMRYRTFLVYNGIGALLWANGVTLLGYFLGNVAFIRNNVEAIFIVIVLVSVVPIVLEYLRHRSKARRAGTVVAEGAAGDDGVAGREAPHPTSARKSDD